MIQILHSKLYLGDEVRIICMFIYIFNKYCIFKKKSLALHFPSIFICMSKYTTDSNKSSVSRTSRSFLAQIHCFKAEFIMSEIYTVTLEVELKLKIQTFIVFGR